MSSWIFVPIVVFMILGLRQRTSPGRRFGWALLAVLCVLGWQAASMGAV